MELSAPLHREPLAIVAVGGYGRGEQCLYSDVDLMVLHRGADVATATDTVLYPLWDAHLKVGHSVRTVGEAAAIAKESFETLTSLLTMRLISGDGDLVVELEAELASMLRGRPLASQLAAAEWERRQVDPYPVMAADLKEGRGGLRTFQGFEWERRRAFLVAISPGAMTLTAAETIAYGDLLAVRNAVHAAAGRSNDRFVVDLREPAADWLGVDVESIAEMMCRSTHVGDKLAERRWPDLLGGQHDPMVAAGRSVVGRITSRFRRRQPSSSAASSALELAVVAAARPGGVWLDGVESERIRAADRCRWRVADREALMKLLAAGDRGRAAWGLLDDLGWVALNVPEWEHVQALPQLAAFHEHPVDAHLWRTVDEIRALETDSDPIVRTVFDEVGSTEDLMLAAWLHDIGKGMGGDHSAVGADIARRLLPRLGFGPATTATVYAAVHHHLLLPETATRRDIDDPAVIDMVADAAGDQHTLRVLYLLAIADARATGASTWTAWKGTLLRSLYARVLAALGAAPAAPKAGIEAVIQLAAGVRDAREIEEHLAALPADYLASTPPPDALWHMDVLQHLTPPVALDVVSTEGTDRVVVAGVDRTGFLGTVAAAFAVHGVSVRSARLFTRADGSALDTFEVADDLTGGTVPDDRWPRIRSDLSAALSGEHDLTPDVAARAKAYRSGERTDVPVSVRFPDRVASPRATTIEVRCADRIGRLAEIVAALYSADLDVSYAKLDTRAGEVVDTFSVRRNGHPIVGEAALEELAAAVCAALE
jgi:[protein-PII] uridylyltransferase